MSTRTFRDNLRRACATDRRNVVGGLWEQMGALQFEYLVAEGLQPHHRLLDLGCGSLRGGVHFVGYLEPGHYYGLDSNPTLLDAGREELERAGLEDRGATLRCTDTFEIEGGPFDYAIAQSLFTHLPLNSIRRCLLRLAPHLQPGGRFYATFLRAGDNPLATMWRFGWESYFDRDPYHYKLADLEWAAGRAGLRMTDLGEWNHPRDQEMLLFQRDGELETRTPRA